MFYHILLLGFLTQTSIQTIHYDYVIIGGGTCGLTVANRLSSHPDTTVAVIEPGKDEHDNPNVTSILGLGLAFNTSVDWQYMSTNQIYAANQQVEYHSGKAWGGSSAINGLTYIRAQNAHIDAWETLGNEGWNWSTLFPYYRKSEAFQIPTPAQTDAGASYIPDYHGYTGPVNVGYPLEMPNGSLASLVNITWRNLGYEFNPDPNGGYVDGFSVWPMTVDRDKDVRADAARAYYYPVRERTNLVMIQGLVNRIIWKEDTMEDALAEGVEFTAPDGTVQRLYANKEVILSAGAIRSPAILELSGVGNPDILTQNNIPIRIPLPAVGENAQDQPNNVILYAPRTPNLTDGILPYATFITASDLFGPNLSTIANTTLAAIPEWATTLSLASNSTVSIPSLTTQLLLQHSLIFTDQVPCAEIFTTRIESSLASSVWPLMPFSRGSVHITSSNPEEYPALDPRFFIIDWDVTFALKVAELAGLFWATEPARWMVGERVFPSAGVELDAEWVRGSFYANHHLVGTAIMLPRELGGVVGTNLRVYGTRNVRVIDASVLPMHLSGHLTSTLYAVAERAADLIMDDW
ncbi:GMC family oxidoreductase [Aspergillus ibericus CBS 121593]|uniref:glucose oxidase n=1 Tax=Aspergillus ibericus CBS 121593 TaxID=1448316 RepID=A0A395HBV8_9EURO|nr:alcohol oxidase [Aspergillus ibericus CBS 121593]RAL05397.1 alcohol oxidase [Aspergillus ibericus CBS 121593]